jgi:hypothetical protein
MLKCRLTVVPPIDPSDGCVLDVDEGLQKAWGKTSVAMAPVLNRAMIDSIRPLS